MRIMAFLWLWSLLALAVPWQVSVAQGFADVATVSATMGINGGRVCVGEASRGDIGCPTYAPTVAAAGGVSISQNLDVTGALTAGSAGFGPMAATNVSVSALDVTGGLRVSGTSRVQDLVVNGNLQVSGSQTIDGVLFANGGISMTGTVTSGNISVTNLSATVADIRTLRVTTRADAPNVSVSTNLDVAGALTAGTAGLGLTNATGISITTGNGISSTNGFFAGNVAIGTMVPSGNLTIFSSASWPTNLILANVAGNSSQFQVRARNGDGGLFLTLNDPSGVQGILLSPNRDSFLNGAGGRLGVGITNPSATFHVSGTTRITSWTVIGANMTATAALDVYGTISATGVSVTGVVSATRFVGDGSGLTGVIAAGSDRISSGTTSFVVVSETGYISLTQGGMNTGWFDPTRGLVTLGVSATGGISGTSLNAIWAGPDNGLFLQRTDGGTFSISQGGSTPYRWVIQTTAANSDLAFSVGSSERLRILSNGNIAIGINTASSTLHVAGTARITSWTAIGANVTATTALDVYGTVSATGASVTGVVSATRFEGQFVGDGSGLTGVVASTGDRVVSGTTSFVAVSNTGYISLTQGGSNTGWFDPTRGLVTLGVNATGGISASQMFISGPASGLPLSFGSLITDTTIGLYTSGTVRLGFGVRANVLRFHVGSLNHRFGFFSTPSGTEIATILGTGQFGLGTNAPSSTLHVIGTGRISSWTAIAADVTATAALDVYGTVSATGVSVTGVVSATRFIGDGSGLTGVTAAATDRIVSGTTSFVVVSETGYISLTQGTFNTGWFDPTRGLVTLGVSATGGISGTTGYFSGPVGIGTPHLSNPSYTLDVLGPIRVFGTNNPGLTVSPTAGSIFTFGANTSVNGAGIYDNTANQWRLVVRNSTGLVGIGVSNPQTRLEVAGSISASGLFSSGDITATGRTVTAGAFVGDGSGLTGVVAASSDRITSGTTSFVVVSNTGYISLTQGGTNTGWFDPTRGLVTLGVSATGGISGTTGYFSGPVGIGTTTPSDQLEVVASNATVAKFRRAPGAAGGAGIILINNSDTGFAVTVGGVGASAGDLALYPDNASYGRLGILIKRSDGFVGVNMNAVQPSSTLHVSGTIMASRSASSGDCDDATDDGKLRRNAVTGRYQFCRWAP
jgi:hypothetical protein